MTLAIDDCRYAGDRTFRIADAPTSAHMTKGDRARYSELTDENRVLVGELQDKLYADGKEGLVILLQAMDAAGKDSTIRHVMSGMNPQGIDVYGFKQPTRRELAHDYLWRAARCLPERGKIALFNRSYYEDVLVVRVDGLWHDYRMPGRCLDCTEDEFFSRRFGQIRDFEEHLYQNGYRVLKVFLNVGLDEQRKACSRASTTRPRTGSSLPPTWPSASTGTPTWPPTRTRSTRPRPSTPRGTWCRRTRSGTPATWCPRPW